MGFEFAIFLPQGRQTRGLLAESRGLGAKHGQVLCIVNGTIVFCLRQQGGKACVLSSQAGESEDLRTPYVVDDKLDLAAWARDAVALTLPDKILCRADCAGLCPVCGKNLNEEPHTHDEAPSDSRWAALESLREQL